MSTAAARITEGSPVELTELPQPHRWVKAKNALTDEQLAAEFAKWLEPSPEIAALHLFTCIAPQSCAGECSTAVRKPRVIKNPKFESLHDRNPDGTFGHGGAPSAPKKTAKKAAPAKMTPAKARERLDNAVKMFGSDRSRWSPAQRRDAEKLDAIAAPGKPAAKKAAPKAPAKKAAVPRKAAAPKTPKATPADVAQAFQGVKSGDVSSDQLEPQVKGLTSPQLDALADELGLEGWKPRATKAAKVAAVMQVARGVEDGNAIMGRAKPAPKKVPPATSLAERRRALKDAIASGEASSESLGGGGMAEVDRITFNNGTVAIRKRAPVDNVYGRSAVMQQDAEELSAAVADAIGVPAPAVLRTGKNEIYMEFVPDPPGAGRVGDEKGWAAAARETAPGKRLGLLDELIDNDDRHAGNYMVSDAAIEDLADGDITAIDHGLAFANSPAQQGLTWGSAFSRDFVRAKNPLTPRDVEALGPRLEALRGEFTRLKRARWFKDMMMRWEILARNAGGSEDVLDHGSAA